MLAVAAAMWSGSGAKAVVGIHSRQQRAKRVAACPGDRAEKAHGFFVSAVLKETPSRQKLHSQ